MSGENERPAPGSPDGEPWPPSDRDRPPAPPADETPSGAGSWTQPDAPPPGPPPPVAPSGPPGSPLEGPTGAVTPPGWRTPPAPSGPVPGWTQPPGTALPGPPDARPPAGAVPTGYPQPAGPTAPAYYSHPGYPPQPAYPPQPGYPGAVPVPPYRAPARGDMDMMAVVSLILGILGLVTCLGIPSPLGLFLGLASRNKIRESNGVLRGAGLAVAGVILGALGSVELLVVVVLVIVNAVRAG